MAAVVKQDPFPAVYLARDLLLDLRRRFIFPVVTSHVPHDGFEAKAPRYAQSSGTTSAKRRTKEIRVRAHCVVQGLAALLYFGFDVATGAKGQQRVVEGMIADDVAGVRDFTSDVGALLDEAADQE